MNNIMRRTRLLSLCFLASLFFTCSSALPGQSAAPSIRIVEPVNESRLATLKGSVHPYAISKNDRGRVSGDLQMGDLILVLSRSAAQQAAFDKFVSAQYELNSPDFHRWLTAEQIGEQFGPAETDISTISNWLIGRGFSIDEVSKDRMSIRFSGSASQVESAFHTEIHDLDVKGETHIANMTDVKIPEALAPAVVGVKALHNFFARPLHRIGPQLRRDPSTGKWTQVNTETALRPSMALKRKRRSNQPTPILA